MVPFGEGRAAVIELAAAAFGDELVSAPSGQITTITLQDGAPDRLVNLYRGRGGAPSLEGVVVSKHPRRCPISIS